MTDGGFQGVERRHIHEDCTMHSSVDTMQKINVALSTIACVILATLLTVAIDINSSLKTSDVRINRLEQIAEMNTKRITELETQSLRFHTPWRNQQ